jgi:hypothetical protein
VECDGATYHSAKSARDRDRLRQDILEGLGWKIRRIWSTDWFKNPQAQLQPILKDLESLRTPIATKKFDEVVNPIIGNVIETGGIRSGKIESGFERVSSDVAETEIISLCDRLRAFDESHIRAIYPDTEIPHRLLRKEMLDALLKHLPCSKAEFLENIPAYLRTGTSVDEAKLLDPVLKIIADYS